MDFFIFAALAVLGAALIAGGIVAYWKSASVTVKALSAAAIAAGVVMWAILVFIIPASVSSA